MSAASGFNANPSASTRVPKRVRLPDPSFVPPLEPNTFSGPIEIISPSAAAKSVGHKRLVTHLPLLVNFLDPKLNKLVKTHSISFYKALTSEDLRSNSSAAPASCRLGFKVTLCDGASQGEAYNALTAEFEAFIENAQQVPAGFARRGFELNRKQFDLRNIDALVDLVYSVILGLIAQHGADGCPAD